MFFVQLFVLFSFLLVQAAVSADPKGEPYNLAPLEFGESIPEESFTVGIGSHHSGELGSRSDDYAFSLDWSRSVGQGAYIGVGGEYRLRSREGVGSGKGVGDVRLRAGVLMQEETRFPELIGALDLSLPANREACGPGSGELPVASMSAGIEPEIRMRKRYHPLTLQASIRARFQRGFDCAGVRVQPGRAVAGMATVWLWISSAAQVGVVTEVGYRAGSRLSSGRHTESINWARQGLAVSAELGEHWSVRGESLLGVFGAADGLDLSVTMSYRR